ncbi:PstS family phosphate ABC transporter substrate-binding protein [Roseibium sp.]|uniref:PstS family phosphate ABC transporter substrate-binding protein n=1 Tax=Roseibium sp. TaxID=1936156 RepID=UPI003A96FBCB
MILSATVAPSDLPRSTDPIALKREIAIVGNDGMEPLVRALCERYLQIHPDTRFHLTLRGSSTAIRALACDAAWVAPMSRAPWAGELAAFRSAKGYAPTGIHIGYTGHGPRSGAKTPPSLYVHKTNPLGGLAMAEVAGIFSSGSPGGDINFWHQLGLAGEWADRRIHLYGLRDDGKYASAFKDAHLSGRAYASHYEALADRRAVIEAVAKDPFGIGCVGWFDAASVSKEVRVLPLSRERGGQTHTPALESVRAGVYPLSAFTSLYFDLAPNTQLQGDLKDYLRLALSDEGQAMVAAMTDTAEGYVPLSPEDLAQERRKLE